MNDIEREILVIAQEECAEVIQEISKCFRFGIDNMHKSGITHRAKLEEEVGDLMCMIDLMVQHGIIDQVAVDQAMVKKVDKLKIYSNIFVDNEDK